MLLSHANFSELFYDGTGFMNGGLELQFFSLPKIEQSAAREYQLFFGLKKHVSYFEIVNAVRASERATQQLLSPEKQTSSFEALKYKQNHSLILSLQC